MLVVEEFIIDSVSNILGSLLVLGGSLTLLFLQSWKVALVAVVVVPMLAIVSNLYSRRIKTGLRDAAHPRGRTGLHRTGDAHLDPAGAELRPRPGRPRAVLQADREEHDGPSLSAANIQAQFSFVVALLEAFAICAVVWLGTWLVQGNALTVGTLILFHPAARTCSSRRARS